MDLKKINTIDAHLLLSIINMKLRNDHSSLTDLGRCFDIDINELKQKLSTIGYHYQQTSNQFISTHQR